MNPCIFEAIFQKTSLFIDFSPIDLKGFLPETFRFLFARSGTHKCSDHPARANTQIRPGQGLTPLSRNNVRMNLAVVHAHDVTPNHTV